VAQLFSQFEGGCMETQSMSENDYGRTLDGLRTAVELTSVEVITGSGGNAGVTLRKT
jgi:hypothetical protein